MASSARLDELKKKFDENPRRYFAPLANEFRKMGEIEQAIMICEEFLPQQAGHMSGHIVYGQALFEAGRLEESRTVFETALTLDPENLIALRHLGDIAKGNGELETARHWYTRVLDADPRNEEIQQLLYSLDDTPSVVLDETKLAAPNAAPVNAADQRFAPPPPAIPELPKSETHAPPPPAIPQLPKEDAAPAPRAAQPKPPAPAAAPLDLDLDDALSEMSMPTTVSPVPNVERSESVNLDGLEPTSTAEMYTPGIGRAEGLEPSEFVPPPPSANAPSLIDSFEAGEFTAPTTSIAPLAGLEETSVGGAAAAPPPPPAAPRASELLPLDLDDGLSLAPQGDAVTAPMPSASAPAPPASPADDFLIPDASAGQRKPRPSMAHDVTGLSEAPDLSGLPELDVTPGPPRAEPEIPAELPPPVLAAEAELVYLVPPDDVEAAPPAPAAAAQPFVTETMAELYLKQGFREQALDVYRQLLAATPGDARLRARVAELQAAPAPAVRPPDTGPNVREFLARIAALRPGARAAGQAPPSADDFASFDSAPSAPASPTNGAAHEQWEAPAAAPSAAPTSETRPSGSIDALFGSRATTSEDSAASALAQAFGGAVEAPSMAGRPARAASKELSLDSVFRDSSGRPPRASGSFSFDQFFSESASPPPAERPPVRTTGPHETVSSEPAERSADDISQFNSWLQGLKQR